MIRFEKTVDETNRFDKAKISYEIEHSDIDLSDLLNEFSYFLKAIGYELGDYHLELVSKEEKSC